MSNPWSKKNPLLSMWMSGANTVWGSARGHAVAQAHRQFNMLAKESTNQVFRFWTGGLAVTPARKKRKSR